MVELSGKSAHEVEFELKQRAVFRRVRIKLRQREEKKLYHGFKAKGKALRKADKDLQVALADPEKHAQASFTEMVASQRSTTARHPVLNDAALLLHVYLSVPLATTLVHRRCCRFFRDHVVAHDPDWKRKCLDELKQIPLSIFDARPDRVFVLAKPRKTGTTTAFAAAAVKAGIHNLAGGTASGFAAAAAAAAQAHKAAEMVSDLQKLQHTEKVQADKARRSVAYETLCKTQPYLEVVASPAMLGAYKRLGYRIKPSDIETLRVMLCKQPSHMSEIEARSLPLLHHTLRVIYLLFSLEEEAKTASAKVLNEVENEVAEAMVVGLDGHVVVGRSQEGGKGESANQLHMPRSYTSAVSKVPDAVEREYEAIHGVRRLLPLVHAGLLCPTTSRPSTTNLQTELTPGTEMLLTGMQASHQGVQAHEELNGLKVIVMEDSDHSKSSASGKEERSCKVMLPKGDVITVKRKNCAAIHGGGDLVQDDVRSRDVLQKRSPGTVSIDLQHDRESVLRDWFVHADDLIPLLNGDHDVEIKENSVHAEHHKQDELASQFDESHDSVQEVVSDDRGSPQIVGRVSNLHPHDSDFSREQSPIAESDLRPGRRADIAGHDAAVAAANMSLFERKQHDESGGAGSTLHDRMMGFTTRLLGQNQKAASMLHMAVTEEVQANKHIKAYTLEEAATMAKAVTSMFAWAMYHVDVVRRSIMESVPPPVKQLVSSLYLITSSLHQHSWERLNDQVDVDNAHDRWESIYTLAAMDVQYYEKRVHSSMLSFHLDLDEDGEEGLSGPVLSSITTILERYHLNGDKVGRCYGGPFLRELFRWVYTVLLHCTRKRISDALDARAKPLPDSAYFFVPASMDKAVELAKEQHVAALSQAAERRRARGVERKSRTVSIDHQSDASVSDDDEEEAVEKAIAKVQFKSANERRFRNRARAAIKMRKDVVSAHDGGMPVYRGTPKEQAGSGRWVDHHRHNDVVDKDSKYKHSKGHKWHHAKGYTVHDAPDDGESDGDEEATHVDLREFASTDRVKHATLPSIAYLPGRIQAKSKYKTMAQKKLENRIVLEDIIEVHESGVMIAELTTPIVEQDEEGNAPAVRTKLLIKHNTCQEKIDDLLLKLKMLGDTTKPALLDCKLQIGKVSRKHLSFAKNLRCFPPTLVYALQAIGYIMMDNDTTPLILDPHMGQVPSLYVTAQEETFRRIYEADGAKGILFLRKAALTIITPVKYKGIMALRKKYGMLHDTFALGASHGMGMNTPQAKREGQLSVACAEIVSTVMMRFHTMQKHADGLHWTRLIHIKQRQLEVLRSKLVTYDEYTWNRNIAASKVPSLVDLCRRHVIVHFRGMDFEKLCHMRTQPKRGLFDKLCTSGTVSARRDMPKLLCWGLYADYYRRHLSLFGTFSDPLLSTCAELLPALCQNLSMLELDCGDLSCAITSHIIETLPCIQVVKLNRCVKERSTLCVRSKTLRCFELTGFMTKEGVVELETELQTDFGVNQIQFSLCPHLEIVDVRKCTWLQQVSFKKDTKANEQAWHHERRHIHRSPLGRAVYKDAHLGVGTSIHNTAAYFKDPKRAQETADRDDVIRAVSTNHGDKEETLEEQDLPMFPGQAQLDFDASDVGFVDLSKNKDGMHSIAAGIAAKVIASRDGGSSSDESSYDGSSSDDSDVNEVGLDGKTFDIEIFRDSNLKGEAAEFGIDFDWADALNCIIIAASPAPEGLFAAQAPGQIHSGDAIVAVNGVRVDSEDHFVDLVSLTYHGNITFTLDRTHFITANAGNLFHKQHANHTKDLRGLVNSMDKNGDGLISKAEFTSAVFSRPDIVRLLGIAGENDSEWAEDNDPNVPNYEGPTVTPVMQKRMKTLWLEIDDDDCGAIEPEELCEYLVGIGRMSALSSRSTTPGEDAAYGAEVEQKKKTKKNKTAKKKKTEEEAETNELPAWSRLLSDSERDEELAQEKQALWALEYPEEARAVAEAARKQSATLLPSILSASLAGIAADSSAEVFGELTKAVSAALHSNPSQQLLGDSSSQILIDTSLKRQAHISQHLAIHLNGQGYVREEDYSDEAVAASNAAAAAAAAHARSLPHSERQALGSKPAPWTTMRLLGGTGSGDKILDHGASSASILSISGLGGFDIQEETVSRSCSFISAAGLSGDGMSSTALASTNLASTMSNVSSYASFISTAGETAEYKDAFKRHQRLELRRLGTPGGTVSASGSDGASTERRFTATPPGKGRRGSSTHHMAQYSPADKSGKRGDGAEWRGNAVVGTLGFLSERNAHRILNTPKGISDTVGASVTNGAQDRGGHACFTPKSGTFGLSQPKGVFAEHDPLSTRTHRSFDGGLFLNKESLPVDPYSAADNLFRAPPLVYAGRFSGNEPQGGVTDEPDRGLPKIEKAAPGFLPKTAILKMHTSTGRPAFVGIGGGATTALTAREENAKKRMKRKEAALHRQAQQRHRRNLGIHRHLGRGGKDDDDDDGVDRGKDDDDNASPREFKAQKAGLQSNSRTESPADESRHDFTTLEGTKVFRDPTRYHEGAHLDPGADPNASAAASAKKNTDMGGGAVGSFQFVSYGSKRICRVPRDDQINAPGKVHNGKFGTKLRVQRYCSVVCGPCVIKRESGVHELTVRIEDGVGELLVSVQNEDDVDVTRARCHILDTLRQTFTAKGSEPRHVPRPAKLNEAEELLIEVDAEKREAAHKAAASALSSSTKRLNSSNKPDKLHMELQRWETTPEDRVVHNQREISALAARKAQAERSRAKAVEKAADLVQQYSDDVREALDEWLTGGKDACLGSDIHSGKIPRLCTGFVSGDLVTMRIDTHAHTIEYRVSGKKCGGVVQLRKSQMFGRAGDDTLVFSVLNHSRRGWHGTGRQWCEASILSYTASPKNSLGCPRLHTLRLHHNQRLGADIDGVVGGLHAVQHLEHLTTLDVKACERLTHHDLSMCLTSISLTSLYLSRLGITETNMIDLFDNMSSASIEELGLSLDWCSDRVLSTLYKDKAAVTGDRFETNAPLLMNLKRASFAGCQNISAKAVSKLVFESPVMEYLDIGGTTFGGSLKARRMMEYNRPGIVVEYEVE